MQLLSSFCPLISIQTGNDFLACFLYIQKGKKGVGGRQHSLLPDLPMRQSEIIPILLSYYDAPPTL